MKRLDISYFLRQGVGSIFSHGFMSFAAVTVMMACLIITGSFSLVAFNIDHMIAKVESQSEITVYIDEALPTGDAQALKDTIASAANVSKAVFVSKEQALSEFRKELGEDSSLVDGLQDDNPLRNSYRIFIKDVKFYGETVEALKKIPQVASVVSRKDITDRLIKVRSVVNAVSFVLIVMLGTVSLFIISNTVKLATFTRREEIAIMKMVGATNNFIRAPFVVEGFLLGLTSSVTAFFAQWGIYYYLGKTISAGFGLFALVPFSGVSQTAFLFFLASGTFVGTAGSLLAIRKFLNV
ncbi:MAG: permease-like cell division protein FtsX [Bacillota bacterium]|nr:permease-like cell division protein FtsX [Bacillota bacterium]